MISVAIDGPSGAGKSTISKIVAKRLGYIYVDTGALYRAIGLYTLNKKVDTKNENDVTEILNEIRVELKYINEVQHVFLNDQDVSDKIRTGEVSMAASDVSAIPSVRKFLFDLQQNLAKTNNIVMDGRDIGTVVLPFATVKIFLTASPEERATRRFEEMTEKGMQVNYDSVLEDIIKRDYNDSHRDIAPLKPAETSIVVDTTGNSLDQSVEQLYSIIHQNII